MISSNYRPVLRVNENLLGRDFAIGDIHGAVKLLELAMDEANFDDANDRLFLLGDVIDRGPESHLVAEILKKPYVLSVAGNHEMMLLEIYENGIPDEAIVEFYAKQNGLNWWLDIKEDHRQEIISELKKLPLAIEIQTKRGTVGLIHAEVPAGMDWDTFLANLEAGDKDTITSCLWGRDRHEAINGVAATDHDGVPGVGRLFVGHNMHFDGLKQYGNVFSIDTAACLGAMNRHPGGKITMVNTIMKTQVLAAERKVSLVDFRDEVLTPITPFGNYGVKQKMAMK